MNITLYGLLQDNEQHPVLIREDEHDYDAKNLSNPEAIAAMLNAVFKADRQCEEHLYLIAMNTANEVLGIFDVSHGTQLATLVDPRAIYTRCMLVGAATIVLAHNHPSGGIDPSADDKATCRRVRDAGKLLGIFLIDFLIIGKDGNYLSFLREGICDLKI